MSITVAVTQSYVSDKSEDISSLQAYANIRKLFMKYNTGLPSSASVEKLFSLGGREFSPFKILAEKQSF